jgi:hypothetical protein
MYPDHSDLRMYADLADLNRGFLGLLTEPGSRQAVPTYGLDAAIVDQLRRLSPQELEFIAGTPGLLACFSRLPAAALLQVAEMPVIHRSEQSDLRESARLYAIGLLTYLWQMEQRDWPCCALCAGSAEKGSGLLGKFDFAQIRASADFAVGQLRARFTNHPSFWTDLIRSARSGDEDFQLLSQLTIIPLVLAEECSTE